MPKGWIFVQCSRSRLKWFRRYVVMVDGAPHRALRSGDHCAIGVPVGEHLVHIRAGWGGSGQELRLTVAEGGRAVLTVQPSTGRSQRSHLRGWVLKVSELEDASITAPIGRIGG